MAWKDIHGYGDKHLPRDPELAGLVLKGVKEPGIIQSSQENHARLRRSLAHAFSEKALREQEPIIQGYVNELMSQLEDLARSGEKVDLATMYTRTTVDITSELAFGTSFDTLTTEKFRPWMAMQSMAGKQLVLLRTMVKYPIIAPIIKAVTPKELINFLTHNRVYVNEVVTKRLEQGVMEEKRDFTSYMLKNRDEGKGMTEGELRETSRSLILAGADTTRNALSTATYWLLQDPEAMKKATTEIRDAFDSVDDINFLNVTAKLPYALACLDEGMRLRPPAGSVTLSRISPDGPPITIADYEVPPNVSYMLNVIQGGRCTDGSPRCWSWLINFR